MKKTISSLLAVTASLWSTSIDVHPQRDSLWHALHPTKPAHWLTAKEAKERELYRKNYVPPRNNSIPKNPRSIAEFEPVEAVIIAFPREFGFEMNLVKELSKDIKVYILAAKGDISRVESILDQNNAPKNNIEIIGRDKVDSYWTRDYGPWCIAEGDEKISIVDFRYNRPRPNDNGIPSLIAQKLKMDSYYMDLEQCGGNYMSNGVGEAVATDLVIEENPNKGEAKVRDLMKKYLGIEQYHITQDPLGEYIKHVDCWGKYLAPDKILIAEVSGSKKAAYDDVAQYFENLTSPYGTPYKVYRVYTEGEPYTNSTIVNDKVFVPIQGTPNDEKALAVYREAMPGYKIIGITNRSKNPWRSTDALHCRTKGIANRKMLHIAHTPLSDTISFSANKKRLNFTITPYSTRGLYLDSTFLFVRKGFEESYSKLPLSKVEKNLYEATILGDSKEGSIKIEYYIEALDSAKERAHFPIMGKYDPIVFYGKNDITAIKKPQNSTSNFTLRQEQNALNVTSQQRGLFILYNTQGKKLLQKNISAEGVLQLEQNRLGTGCLLYQFQQIQTGMVHAGKVILR